MLSYAPDYNSHPPKKTYLKSPNGWGCILGRKRALKFEKLRGAVFGFTMNFEKFAAVGKGVIRGGIPPPPRRKKKKKNIRVPPYVFLTILRKIKKKPK